MVLGSSFDQSDDDLLPLAFPHAAVLDLLCAIRQLDPYLPTVDCMPGLQISLLQTLVA